MRLWARSKVVAERSTRFLRVMSLVKWSMFTWRVKGIEHVIAVDILGNMNTRLGRELMQLTSKRNAISVIHYSQYKISLFFIEDVYTMTVGLHKNEISYIHSLNIELLSMTEKYISACLSNFWPTFDLRIVQCIMLKLVKSHTWQ